MNETASESTIAATDDVETLPEELIFEDNESSPEKETMTEPALVRTAAFLADKNTSTFLIPETVASLVSRQQIQSGIVDLSTEAGIAIARHLVYSGIAYSVFESVGVEDLPKCLSEMSQLLKLSQGYLPFNPEDITSIDANIVLIPAAADDAGPGIDVSEGTITGTVIEQMQSAKLDCLLVLPPESGLRRQEDGSYVRLTLRLAE